MTIDFSKSEQKIVDEESATLTSNVLLNLGTDGSFDFYLLISKLP